MSFMLRLQVGLMEYLRESTWQPVSIERKCMEKGETDFFTWSDSDRTWGTTLK